ncbi:hypothetical protein [Rhodococcus gannanensis]|uniref:Secreted protein n=1 Tax=Rhodococcus gannanensis TaxID=1960308 RepID=A0ABW4P2C5_9NOCA
MKKNTLRALTVTGVAAAAVLGAAGTASADHVDKPKPSGPPWSVSHDGLTYCFEGYCESWDKLGNYVCTTGAPTAPVCDAVMIGVRLLPPLNIGDLVPHNIIH